MTQGYRSRTKDERQETRMIETSDDYWAYRTKVWPANFVGKVSTIEDRVHPNFEKLSAQGQIIIDGVLLEREERTFASGDITYFHLGAFFNMTGDVAHFLEFHEPVVPPIRTGESMAATVITKAYAEMKKSTINTGEILADLDNTIGMFKEPYKSARVLACKIIASKKRRLRAAKTAKQVARAGSDAWLEYRYGWQPILMDCESIGKEVKARADASNAVRKRKVSRAGAAENRSGSKAWSSEGVPYKSWGTSGLATTKVSVRCSAGVLYDQTVNTALKSLDKTLGVRPSDLPATFWETVPYSFVVDWFVNVGDWIQAITPVPGIDVRGSWLTTVSETTRKVTGTMLSCGKTPRQLEEDPRDHGGSFGSSERKTLRYERVSNPSVPITPVWTGKPMSLLHSVDSIALLQKPLMALFKEIHH